MQSLLITKVYSFASTVCSRSHHDVTILWHSDMYVNWYKHFAHTYEYFEYLLGDLGYMGEYMFIMWQIGWCELSLNTHPNTMNAYNNMHVGYKVKVERGIGGFKTNWQKLMKSFNHTKPNHLFHNVALLTNFLQRRKTFRSLGSKWKIKWILDAMETYRVYEGLRTILDKIKVHYIL